MSSSSSSSTAQGDALLEAAEEGDVSKVQQLLDQGVDINYNKNADGVSKSSTGSVERLYAYR